MQIMEQSDIPNNLRRAVRNLITNTKVKVDERTAETVTGVPQGSCTSPTWWIIYVDKLLRELNKETGNKALAYADDLVCVVKGELMLKKMYRHHRKMEQRIPHRYQ